MDLVVPPSSLMAFTLHLSSKSSTLMHILFYHEYLCLPTQLVNQVSYIAQNLPVDILYSV
jgi:hypothetical protein